MKELGIRYRSWANVVIAAEALNRDIQVNRRGTGVGLVLSHEGRRYRWHQGASNLNSSLAGQITRNKDVASRLLLNRGVSVPENAVFRMGDEDRAWAWATSLLPIVLKPHNGTHGDNVHVGIDSRQDFERAFAQVAAAGEKVLVEQFRHGVEHRFLVMDAEVVAVTRRRPASVVGDGTSSISALVNRKNKRRGRIHKPIKLGEHELGVLSKQALSPGAIPGDGQRVTLRETSNIHTGGDSIDATDSVTREEREYVERAARAIPGLRLAGFDVLLPRNGEGDSPVIIEINSAPMITIHHFPWEGKPRDIAAHVIDAMFPGTRRQVETIS